MTTNILAIPCEYQKSSYADRAGIGCTERSKLADTIKNNEYMNNGKAITGGGLPVSGTLTEV